MFLGTDKPPEGSLAALVLQCLVSSVDTGPYVRKMFRLPAATDGGAVVPGVGSVETKQ